MIKLLYLFASLTTFDSQKIIDDISKQTAHITIVETTFDNNFCKKHSNTLLTGHINGYYDAKENKIYTPKGYGFLVNGNLAKHSGEIVALKDMMIFHERVHAYLDISKIDADDFMFRALNEGFAEYCTWLYARQNKVEKLFLRRQNFFAKGGQKNIPVEGQKFYLDPCFFYHDSFHFFKTLIAKDKNINLRNVFLIDKPSIKEVLFPELYLQRAGKKRQVPSLCENGSLINHLGFRKFLLEQNIFVDEIRPCLNLRA